VHRVGFGVIAALAIAASLTAQSVSSPTQSSQPQQPVFRTEANYIRVDAFVTLGDDPVSDLTAADFELLEDGAPQKIDAFEFVRIQPAGPQATRIEPNSQRDANQMAADPRSRVFVLFLDIDHVPVEGSHRVRTELARMTDRMVGQDDFIGLITSRHSPSELILGRKTALIQEQLEKYWYWGSRDTNTPEEDAYFVCFAAYVGGREVAEEMIERRREKLTLDALENLVIHLRGIREERKAVLTISSGWRLFRENPALARPLYLPGPTGQQTPQMPGPPPIGVGPGGRPMLGNDPRSGSMEAMCERDRWELAHTDDWQHFQDLLRDANRANVSFYPIDPRGLVVFDSPLGPRPPLPLQQDREALLARQDALRSMAEDTDGLAVVDRNTLEPGLRRIAADLSSYYLIGYYSSNPALDGKYRKITVRVKRPGMKVRHRRGYRAATREEVEAVRETASAAAHAEPAPVDAVASALGRLALVRPDAAVYVHATGAPDGTLWIAGELSRATAGAPAWSGGGRVSLIALDAAGNTVGMSRKELPAGSRDFLVQVRPDDPSQRVARVMVRAEPKVGNTIGLEIAPGSGEPLLFRQASASGPATPAADFRFYRTETLTFRWPSQADDRPGVGRVLDRTGKPMPLEAAVQVDPAGPWLTGSLRLAPLVQGDYVLEISRQRGTDTARAFVPFRVVR
jgi:VWFA-related protein